MPFAGPAVALAGPTGIGKTSLSFAVGERFDCEIVSVDSMQVYRYMDIGTAKPSLSEQAKIPHHLIDMVNPDQDYHVGRFLHDAAKALAQISRRGKMPLLVGGTGLYLQRLQQGIFNLPDIPQTVRRQVGRLLDRQGSPALHQQLAAVDPVMAARIHPNDRQRVGRGLEIYQATGIPWSQHLAKANETAILPDMLVIALTTDREVLYRRINRRVDTMLAAGLQDEVQKLLDMGYTADLKSMQAIGYRHMSAFLAGHIDGASLRETMARDTRRYAKRQYTWLRRMPNIHWHQRDDINGVLTAVAGYVERRRKRVP